MKHKLLLICLLLVVPVLAHAQKPKVLVGVVTEYKLGPNWDGVIFVSGGTKYFVQLSSNNGDVTKYDTVPKVSDTIRVTYRRLEREFQGGIDVKAVRVTVLSAQSSRTTPATKTTAISSPSYYLGVSRANCCNFSKKEWQKMANILKRSGVPAFFADWRTFPDATPRGDWLVAKIKRLPRAEVDSLCIGPFRSKAAAVDALNKVPRILPDDGYERWYVSENYSANWNIGMYSFLGYQAR